MESTTPLGAAGGAMAPTRGDAATSGAVELALVIRDGRICRDDAPQYAAASVCATAASWSVAASAAGLDAREVIDAENRLVMPGMIDPHVPVHAPRAAGSGVTAIREALHCSRSVIRG